MAIDINVTLSLKPDAETAALLVRMLGKLVAIQESLVNTDEAIAALAAKVAAQGTVIESAVTLLGGLSAQLEAAKDDPAQIAAIITSLDAQTAALADAVVANTPVAPVA